MYNINNNNQEKTAKKAVLLCNNLDQSIKLRYLHVEILQQHLNQAEY